MAAGSSPRESRPCIPHATLLIACDALNARTLTVKLMIFMIWENSIKKKPSGQNTVPNSNYRK